MATTWTPDDPTQANAPEDARPSGARYTYGDVLGVGGMGEVRAATDTRLRRAVAVKRLMNDGASARARFEGEAQVTAQLDHPNIVPVHDLGVDDEGRPFLAMKQVRGRSLRDLLREGAPSLEVRLDVFRKVCDAVAFAHARGVLHRDLKPDNVMVGAFGEVLVMDWGLARPIGAAAAEDAVDAGLSVDRFADATMRTHAGQIAGTPAYMAPEQAAGRIDAMDARTDVYGLGAVLYEVLCGRPPFGGAVDDVLADVRAGRLTPPSAHARVPRELDAVVRKAMALQPEDRYPTVEALREDVDAFVARRPLLHVRSTALERVSKWVDRHRTAVRATLAVALVAIALLVVGMARYLSDVGAARDRALAEAERAVRAEGEAHVQLVAARLALADSRTEAGDITGAGVALREANALADGRAFDRRPLDWALSEHVLRSPLAVATCDLHGAREIVAVAVTARGSEVASLDRNGALVRWAPDGCVEHARVEVSGGARVERAVLRQGASGVEGLVVTDAGITVLAEGRPRVTRPWPGAAGAGSASAGPGAVGGAAAAPRVYHVRLVDDIGYVATEAGTLRLGLRDDAFGRAGEGPTDGAAWWPFGDRVLATSIPTGGELGGIFTTDLRPVFEGAGVTDVDAGAGRAVIASAFGHAVHDLATGTLTWDHGDRATVTAAVVEEADLVVAVRFDGSVHVDRLSDGATVAALEGQGTNGSRVIGISADGRALAVNHDGGGVDVHLLPTRHPTVLPVTFGSTAHAAAVSHDGATLALGGDDGVLFLLDSRTHAQRLRLDGFSPGVRHLRFAPDDRTVLVGLRSGAIGFLDVASGVLRAFEVGGRAPAVDWIDGNTVAVVTTSGEALRFDVATGLRHALGTPLPHSVWGASAVPGTRWLAVNGHGVRGAVDLIVLDTTDGRVVSRRQVDAARYRIAAHPDGTLLASGTQGGTVELWRPSTGEVLRTLPADGGPTMGVAFSPDGSLLASTGFDGDVVLWDTRTWTMLRRIRVHDGPGTAVEWTPDGQGLVSTGKLSAILLRLDAHAVQTAAVDVLRRPLTSEADRAARTAARAALGWD